MGKGTVLFLLISVQAALTALGQVPSKVTLSRANTPTADGFTVAWSDLSNETAYHLEHTTSANFTTSTLITNISANATSRTLTGLTPGTTYYVRVRGAAAGGNGTWSDVQANQLLSIDPGQTRYLSVAGVPHGASHSVNFTISDIFGSANSAGLAAGATASEASTILLLGSDGSTAHTVFYNSSQNQWREGDTNKGSEIVGFGKGFMIKNNTGSADVFLLSGSVPTLEPGAVAVFSADAPAGRLSLVTPSRTMATTLRSLGLTYSNNTTTGLKRATVAKDADLLLIPDSAGGLRRYHFDGTNWRSGLRTVNDPTSVTVPAGGAFFLRKASGSSFQQWRPPLSVVTDGLVLFLDPGNPASYPGSGTTCTDLSGTGNNGTLVNGVGFDGGNGGSFSFNGSNSYLSISNSGYNLGVHFTCQFWTKISRFGGGPSWNRAALISNSYPYSGGQGFLIMATSQNPGNFTATQGRETFFISMGNDQHGCTSAIGSLSAYVNQWVNLAVTVNGTAPIRMYINGNETAYAGQQNGPSSWSYTAGPFSLGIRNNNSEALLGSMSITQIYNRALSDTEIRQNYDATKGRYEIVKDGLVLHLDAGNLASYPGNGTSWTDLSGNGYNGTLTNGPTYNSANGGSIVFDGTNDHVALSSNLSTIVGASLPATWSAWVNVSSSTSNRMIIGSAWANGGAHMRLTGTSHGPADRVRFLYFSDGSNGTGVDSVATFTSGWQNFVVTYNGQGTSHSNFKMYVNGQQVSVTNPTFGSPTSVRTATNFSIGAAAAENTAYYNSNISQVSIYNRVLTDEEILRNFNVHKGRYGL